MFELCRVLHENYVWLKIVFDTTQSFKLDYVRPLFTWLYVTIHLSPPFFLCVTVNIKIF